MLLRSLLFASLQISAALAQTALTSPITSLEVHIARKPTVKKAFQWNTWEAEMGFAFDNVTASAIQSGDYFDFTIKGPLAPYSESSEVPLTYDFYIETDNKEQLFHVTATDDNHSFRATATDFFDSPPGETFNLAGTFSVDFLIPASAPLVDSVFTVGPFKSTISFILPTPLTTQAKGEKVKVQMTRKGTYLIAEIFSLVYQSAGQPALPKDGRFNRLQATSGATFEREPSHPWGFVDAYYIDVNLKRYDGAGSPIDADFAPPGNSFVNASEMYSHLDWYKMPANPSKAVGLYVSARSKMSGSDDSSCFYYTGNYRYVFSLSPICVAQGRGAEGLPNGEGLIAVDVVVPLATSSEVTTSSAEATSEVTTSADIFSEVTSSTEATPEATSSAEATTEATSSAEATPEVTSSADAFSNVTSSAEATPEVTTMLMSLLR
ncbi:hypothetical protein B0I71DRAFT_9939 [Yarrowia lipolytica]|uniref:Uncharacterized protein n=1 Tax=Yarrowia lipolytica TaxID=4952 RepID=A0A371C055_YARLL|nr:hypothetical protein B0I71DRAFT_9939 [Yarrowia lipolytica]